MRRNLLLIVPLWLACALARGEAMRLPEDPALSPDGKQLAFAWNGDIWVVPASGGTARRITSSPSRDSQPCFSPDGAKLAFLSDRAGAPQVFLVPAGGGLPQQLTFHSEGYDLEEWSPDGGALLVSARRDHFWRHAERFFLIPPQPRPRERLLFDAYGHHGRLSPDGKHLLFAREGVAWWRKGYQGSQDSQIWEYAIAEGRFIERCRPPGGASAPLWHPDGQHFYYVGGQSGSFNLYRRHRQTGQEQQLTRFQDELVLMPCISRDGKVLVFRRGFDFYRLETAEGRRPERIRVVYRGDELREPIERRTCTSATEVAFSADGLEVAFIAGGDLWVMDTILREPKQITNTPEEERHPVFAPHGESILFVSDAGGQSDIWQASREDASRYWWLNERFPLKRLTNDPQREAGLRWSPAGSHVAFIQGLGDLWIMEPGGQNPRRLVASWNAPEFDWSPDGRWLVYAVEDNDFNRDVFVLPVDGSRPPFNLSRHPDNDAAPVWSPDGKMIAFTGRRIGLETDIYFVFLQKAEDERGGRERKLEEALEKLKKGRKPGNEPPRAGGQDGGKRPDEKTGPPEKAKPDTTSPEPQAKPEPRPDTPGGQQAGQPPAVAIDFEGIEQRVRRVIIPDATETGLFWSHDSKKLVFTATIGGRLGTYTISPPANLTPALLSPSTGTQARWIAHGNQIVWLSGGIPGSLTPEGKTTAYSFSARQEVDLAKKFAAAFDLCWRAMRDTYYDETLNHRNWDAIRRKYAPLAARAADRRAFAAVVNMMVGELNGSHLGFTASETSEEKRSAWRPQTAHLGVRLNDHFAGPGLKIRDVIRHGPADKTRSRLSAGEIILRINDVAVGPEKDLTELLNGPLDRDIRLQVRGTGGKEREVVIRPVSFPEARNLLYDQWVHGNQAAVANLSQGRLGYAHIAGMNMESFYRFERDLFAAAAGKEGLVIDVRENGGGSTTDHLLTILTQPDHAITVPRGGGPGYPQDRRVYATWNKPIVVLCNQNSFSNAEIFSHAIKTLKRGQLVGVPTAGGVLTVGSTRIMDLGSLRTPYRGWFLLGDGQDMELNGATPDHIVWPQPGELPAGKDPQLATAVQVLLKDVEEWKKRPLPKLIKASQRTSSR